MRTTSGPGPAISRRTLFAVAAAAGASALGGYALFEYWPGLDDQKQAAARMISAARLRAEMSPRRFALCGGHILRTSTNNCSLFLEAVSMSNVGTVSGDHRRQVHTEVRAPIEAVLIRVVWFVFGVIEVLIALRFVLELLGASIKAGFVQAIFAVSGIFMAPFVAIFSSPHVATGSIVEWSALLAIAVYALIAWGIVALIYAVNPRQSSDTVEQVERDEDVQVK